MARAAIIAAMIMPVIVAAVISAAARIVVAAIGITAIPVITSVSRPKTAKAQINADAWAAI